MRLLLVLTLFLAACSSPAPSLTGAPSPTALPTTAPVQGTAQTAASGTPAQSAPTDTPAPAATASATLVPAKLGYIAESDGTAGVLAAIQAAAQDLGRQVETNSGGAGAVAALAQAGAQVVVADGAGLEADTRQAASQFPDAYFIGVNQSGAGDDLPNLLVLGAGPSREDQLGFMAGVVAGYATEAQVVTAVAYPATPSGLKYRNGFLHGVRYSCSRCRVDFVDAVNLEGDSAAVERAALNASLSSDLVFAAAGATGIEALRAAAQKGAWLIGSEADVFQSSFGGAGAEADRVLTSVYFDPGAAVTAALKAYESGTPWNGSRPFSAADNAITLAPIRVSEDVLSQLDRSDIAAVLALLADGSLETGIDPLTGNEL